MPKKSIEQRFWEKVKIQGLLDCWNWTAGLWGEGGYARFAESGTSVKGSRWIWALLYGEIPKGMCVLHKCDNPRCVNPNHLFLGTHQDNMDDKVSKGRQDRTSGEDRWGTKLTDAQVQEIRECVKQGVTTRAIGKKFDISCGYVSMLATGKRRATEGVML